MKTNNKYNIGDIVWFFDSQAVLIKSTIQAIKFDVKEQLVHGGETFLHCLAYKMEGVGIFEPEELHSTPEEAINYYKNL